MKDAPLTQPSCPPSDVCYAAMQHKVSCTIVRAVACIRLAFLNCADAEQCILVQDAMLQLWCHETFRILGDRMWDSADRTWLKGQLDEKLKAIFGTTWDEVHPLHQMGVELLRVHVLPSLCLLHAHH